MKKVIGIVPKGILYEEDTNFKDVYQLGNNYAKCVFEAGMLPQGVLPVDGDISEEALSHFDGFVVMGGVKMWNYHLRVVHHAVENHKPLLGICLGMQLINCYFTVREKVEAEGYTGDLCDAIINAFFNTDKGKNLFIKVEGHRSDFVPRGKEDDAKHFVSVQKDTHLYKLFGEDKVFGATYHNWCIKEPAKSLTVNAYSTDGNNYIEGLEYRDNIVGVQFHPEVDGKLLKLFSFLGE